MMSFPQHGKLLTRNKTLTLKEMTQTISELQKDNFNLRMRICFLKYEGGSQKCSSCTEQIYNAAEERFPVATQQNIDELSRCREELEKMEALFHQEKTLRLQLENQLQAYTLQDPPSEDQSQSKETFEELHRYIEQLQGELKAHNTIINQLRNRSTNQSSGHQPGHAHNSTLTTLREDDIRDLKNLLELKDFELQETKINHEASKNDLQQVLMDKEKQIQGLHDILEGYIQDLAEKDAALAESRSELKNLEADVSKLTLQLENRKQQFQLMSGQLQESVRESQLLKQRLRYTEAFTHPTYQIQAVEKHMLEIHQLKPTLLGTIRRTQDLYRHLQGAERASVKKDHSGRDSGSVCKSSFRSVIKASVCCSDPAQPCLSSRAHVHGLHVLVPREIYDTLLEQMCEGRGLISQASELIQHRLQTQGRHHMQVHSVDQNLLRSLLNIINVTQTTLEEASKLLTSSSKEQNHDRERDDFCHPENLKMKSKLKKPKVEKSYKMNKMLSKHYGDSNIEQH